MVTSTRKTNANKIWVHEFLNEVVPFPNAKFDDQVDMMTQALIRISKSTMGWFEGLTEDQRVNDPNKHIDERIRGIADKFGWNIHNPNKGGLGLDF